MTLLLTGCPGRLPASRLIFGAPFQQVSVGGEGSFLLFRPGDIFGLEVDRNAGDGAADRQFFVARAGRAGDVLAALPAVRPGALILLAAVEKRSAARFAELLQRVSDHRRLASVTAERWQVLASRLLTGLPLEPEEILL